MLVFYMHSVNGFQLVIVSVRVLYVSESWVFGSGRIADCSVWKPENHLHVSAVPATVHCDKPIHTAVPEFSKPFLVCVCIVVQFLWACSHDGHND